MPDVNTPDLPPAESAVTSAPASDDTKRHGTLWIILAILVVLAGAGGAYW